MTIDPHRREQATLLVVDDDAAVRRLLVLTLTEAGHRCLEAADSRSARQRLAAEPVDLVLSDIEMPGESGLALARFIRTRYPQTPVIMVTVIDDFKTAEAALSLDIYGYVVKPVDRQQILISVTNALRRRTLEEKARRYQEDLETAVSERTGALAAANDRLHRQERQLRRQAGELQEMNSALRVLLRQRETDQQNVAAHVSSTIQQQVRPFLDRLARSPLNPTQRHCVEVITAAIDALVSPVLQSMAAATAGLTPIEVQVAQLVKLGHSTKEIAETLCLSVNTIMTHRYNIRTKLGLKNRKQNLYVYLNALSDQ